MKISQAGRRPVIDSNTVGRFEDDGDPLARADLEDEAAHGALEDAAARGAERAAFDGKEVGLRPLEDPAVAVYEKDLVDVAGARRARERLERRAVRDPRRVLGQRVLADRAPRLDADVRLYNAAADAVMAAANAAGAQIASVDLYAYVLRRCGGQGYAHCDGFQLPSNVHYTSEGWAALAAEVGRALAEVGEVR